MKKLLYILLIVPFTFFGQSNTTYIFSEPLNTGANMTVGVNAPILNQFVSGQIGAFYDLNGDGTLQCIGLTTINEGFFGLALWGDNLSTPEKDGLGNGDVPEFAILYNEEVQIIYGSPMFSGYIDNSTIIFQEFSFNQIYGCVDIAACNYIPNLIYDDGSCNYTSESYLNCDGTCINDTDGDEICDELEIDGCNNYLFYDYNPFATDSSECYDFLLKEQFDQICADEFLGFQYDSTSCNNTWRNLFISSLNKKIKISLEEGWNIIGYTNYFNKDIELAFQDVISDVFLVKSNNGDIWWPEYEFNGIGELISGYGYQIKMNSKVEDFSFDESLFGCKIEWADNYNPGFTYNSIDSCYRFGCTESWADNFDSLATENDFTCYKIGCTESWADNFDSQATLNDSSCYRLGCTDPIAFNYDFNATVDNNTCSISIPTSTIFNQPSNTGAVMTVGINAPILDQFDGGKIAAFYDLNGDGILQCVGLETISEGFFGFALWGDDSSTPDKDGLDSGDTPIFVVKHDENIIMLNESPSFTGYVTNGIINITEFTLITEVECAIIGACNYSHVPYEDVSIYETSECILPNSDNDFDFDGVCDVKEVLGCTYAEAINFNSLATEEDGSCANITPDMFNQPANTGTNMTIGVNNPILDQFVSGQFGAFYDLNGDGILQCVGLETINEGFFGLALWGDDSSTGEIKDGLVSGDIPNFAILHEGSVIILDESPDFTGYISNSIVNITGGDLSFKVECFDTNALNYIQYDYSNVYYVDLNTCEY